MELVYLGLSPDVRGAGLGNYLMQVAEARVHEKKVNKLSLGCRCEESARAEALLSAWDETGDEKNGADARVGFNAPLGPASGRVDMARGRG